MLGKAQRLKGLVIKKVQAEPDVPQLTIDEAKPVMSMVPTIKPTIRRVIKTTAAVAAPTIFVPTTPLAALEPAKAEPAKAEPAKAEPAKAEPSQAPSIIRKGRKTILRRKYGPQEEKYRSQRDTELAEDAYLFKGEDAEVFMPATRLAFLNYMRTKFTPFAITKVPEPDFEACAKLGQKGEGVIERFLYQQFVREYLRQETPYRGLLVYHGLGSGKTCSSIAAAEALFSTHKKKIIVMTPGSLRGNFQAELTSCGFRHHSLQNHWVFLPLTETVYKFANEVLGIRPSSFIFREMEKMPQEQRGIWIPDFEQPNNYTSLSAWQQTAIRKQIKAQLEDRITFLSYNSARDTSRSRLQQLACNQPDFFDNAVIIIDEIHNVTRMLCRKMDKELLEKIRRGKNDPAFDPITFERNRPASCGSPYSNTRAYLLYRLLATAKNTKIIGLSGTPLINFPEEVAILANILGGYIHTVDTSIPVTVTAEQDALTILREHSRVDFVEVQKAQTKVAITYSIFPNKYKKVLDPVTKEFKGVEYFGDDEDANTSPADIQQELVVLFKEKGIVLSAPIYNSYPLLPPTKDEFYKAFIVERETSPNKLSANLINQVILMRRIQGLVSYYRGSKIDLMPSVKEDTYVPVPLGQYAYSVYDTARQYERKMEKKKKLSDEIADLEKEIAPGNYRFRSRSACNFAFPSDIQRPYPGNKKATEIDTGAVTSDMIYGESASTVDEEELADRINEEEEISEADNIVPETATETATATETGPTIQELRTYAERLEDAKRKLYSRREEVLKLIDDPDKGLNKYSPKMATILRKIDELDEQAESINEVGERNFYGPHLVYSQFISMEGLGILGVAMEANGYVPIEFEGAFEELKFSKRTQESLEKGPTVKERRFMFFTSNSSPYEREVLLNIFNGRFDKLPVGIKTVLETHYNTTRNLRGEICTVFGLGAAGAEGISLKNVRAVHIMEPYWNNVRIEQVKGRAIRICSHMELPVDQRNVVVYTYCATLGEYEKEDDDGITSDQFLQGVAETKKAINEGILTVMKKASVDCTLNQLENQSVQCYVPKSIDNNSFAYHPNLDMDLRNPPQEVAVIEGPKATVGPLVIKGITNTEKAKAIIGEKKQLEPRVGVEQAAVIAIKGREYIMVPKPGKTELFTLYDKNDTLKTRPLGLLKRDPVSGEFATKMT